MNHRFNMFREFTMIQIQTVVGWLGGFNVSLELRWWAFADGLGFFPKDNPDTCHRNFNLPKRGGSPAFVPPEV